MLAVIFAAVLNTYADFHGAYISYKEAIYQRSVNIEAAVQNEHYSDNTANLELARRNQKFCHQVADAYNASAKRVNPEVLVSEFDELPHYLAGSACDARP